MWIFVQKNVFLSREWGRIVSCIREFKNLSHPKTTLSIIESCSKSMAWSWEYARFVILEPLAVLFTFRMCYFLLVLKNLSDLFRQRNVKNCRYKEFCIQHQFVNSVKAETMEPGTLDDAVCRGLSFSSMNVINKWR